MGDLVSGYDKWECTGNSQCEKYPTKKPTSSPIWPTPKPTQKPTSSPTPKPTQSGSQFICNNNNLCKDDVIVCTGNHECNVECIGVDQCRNDKDDNDDCQSCRNTIINCLNGHDCNIKCSGDYTCYGMTINCPNSADCNVNVEFTEWNQQYGYASNGMINAVINGGNNGNLYIVNNQYNYGMERANIHCPNNGHCNIMANKAATARDYGGNNFDYAIIDASASNTLTIQTTAVSRPLYRSDIYCPAAGTHSNCHIYAESDGKGSGSWGILQEVRFYVIDSINDIDITCNYKAKHPVQECFGDYGQYYQPKITCGNAKTSGKSDSCKMELVSGFDNWKCDGQTTCSPKPSTTTAPGMCCNNLSKGKWINTCKQQNTQSTCERYKTKKGKLRCEWLSCSDIGFCEYNGIVSGRTATKEAKKCKKLKTKTDCEGSKYNCKWTSGPTLFFDQYYDDDDYTNDDMFLYMQQNNVDNSVDNNHNTLHAFGFMVLTLSLFVTCMCLRNRTVKKRMDELKTKYINGGYTPLVTVE